MNLRHLAIKVCPTNSTTHLTSIWIPFNMLIVKCQGQTTLIIWILLVNLHIYSINSKLKCFKTYCILFHAQSNFSLPATWVVHSESPDAEPYASSDLRRVFLRTACRHICKHSWKIIFILIRTITFIGSQRGFQKVFHSKFSYILRFIFIKLNSITL